MIEVAIADKETLDSIKTDTTEIAERVALFPVSIVKSVQRGTFTNDFSTIAYYKDVTISEVNPAKCMITLSGETTVIMRYGSNTSTSVLAATIPNATTLRFSATGVNSNYSATYHSRWELIEFY